jgi:hypothetical protein
MARRARSCTICSSRKAAPFLDHDDIFDLVGERIDQLGIERIGDAELEQRKRAGQAELLQRVFQIRIGERGTDEAERRLAARASRRDAVDAVTPRAGPEAA